MKKLKLIYLNKDQLIKLENNPRRIIDQDGKKKLVKLIKSHGFQNPLQAYKEKSGQYSILAGNHRFEAGLDLNMKEFPCIIYEGNRKKAIARAISDNKSSTWTEFDIPLLKDHFTDLDDGDFDMSLTGFDDDEIKGMFDFDSEPGEGDDDIPEVNEKNTRCKLGDLWQLGGHRLLCGDSTDIKQVERLVNNKKIDMVFTDPPYGMNYDDNTWETTWGNGIKGKKFGKIKGDDKPFDPSFILNIFPKIKEIFIWGFQYYPEKLGRGGIVAWIKKTEAQKNMLHGDFELCWSKAERTKMFLFPWGGFINKERSEGERFHPTQKPIGIIELFVNKWGKQNNRVVDLFLGSGSTLIACEKTNRKCYGMEIDPHYCDVILKRWEDYTGKEAKLIEKEND